MAQQLKTILNKQYEIRTPELCTVTDASGILLCTAAPGCMAHICGDGYPITLSSDAAIMREIPGILSRAWNVQYVSGSTVELEMKTNMVYRSWELASLTLSADQYSDDFISEICFSSGERATELIAPDTWKWSGHHISGSYFVPQPNTRYRLVLMYDGLFLRASVEGVELSQEGGA